MTDIDTLCQQTNNPQMLNALHACRDGHPLNNSFAWRNAHCLAAQRGLEFSGADRDWLKKQADQEQNRDAIT